ncbi:MAG: response regulator [Acidobacteriota bacterium]
MKKLLLIDSQVARATALASRLENASLPVGVKVAPSGLYALTMLEREAPDVVVVSAALDDMPAHELCIIVKQDFAFAGLPVVLLASSEREAEQAAVPRDGSGVFLAAQPDGSMPRVDYDLVLLEGDDVDAAAARLRQFALWSARGAKRAADDDATNPGTQTIVGSLGVLDFSELTQAFSQGRKTGLLTFDLEHHMAEMVFEDGQVVHAAFGDLQAYEAFGRLFYETERLENTTFRFRPMPLDEVAAMPHTITMSAQQLLLTVAVDVDEERTVEMPLFRPRTESRGPRD